jgi:plastocyanin
MLTLPILLTFQQATVTGTVTDKGRPVANSVVWLEGDGSASPIKAKINQKNKTFIPHVLAVPMGSTVDFPNSDDFFHNVFADYNAKKFDLGMYPKGQSRAVTFDKPGLVSILCNMHSEMSAYIVVVKSKHYAVTDKSGSFSFTGVKPGSFVLNAWHESGKKAKQTVDVRPGANLLPVQLAK